MVDWSSAMTDLASSWKVGIAFIILVVLRFLLTSQAVFLANVRTLLFGGIAGLLTTPASTPTSAPPAAEATDDDSADDEAAAAEPWEAEADPPAPSRADELRASVLEFVDSGLIALVLVFLVIRPFVVQAFYIPSGSMRPTLVEDDKILVSKFIYRFREPQRGDVIVFKAPPQAASDEKDFIKRLVGLPGDVLEVRDGTLYVNGQPQQEPYTAEPPLYDMPPVVVEPGKVFVMGDNRNDSNDSHTWGQLDEKRIRGKAFAVFWPVSRIGLIR